MSRSEEDFHPNRTVGRKSWLETVMNEPLDPLSILHPSTSDSTPNNYDSAVPTTPRFSPVIGAELELSNTVSTPRSGQVNRPNGELSENAHYQQNLIPLRRFTNSARTEPGQGNRFQPYAMPSPCLRTKDSGATPLTPADAGKNTTIAEEDGDNTSRSPRKTRGDRKSRKQDIKYKNDGPELCQWAKEKLGLPDPPSLVVALSVGLLALREIREVVYQVPRLLVTRVIDTGPFSGRGKVQRKKDAEEEKAMQQLYEELSKYYQRPTGARHWAPQEVLSNLMRDLEGHPELLLRDDKSTPGASTSTTEAGPGSI